jgi:hypothetical protein
MAIKNEIAIILHQISKLNKELGTLTQQSCKESQTILSISEQLQESNKMNYANSKGISRLIEIIKQNKVTIDKELDDQSENFSEKFTNIYKLIESNSGNLVKIYDSVKRHTSQLEEKEVVLKELKQDIHNIKKQVDKLKVVKGENEVELDKEYEEYEEHVVNMADISKDDIFRYFQFDKSWQDSDLIKKWGDSKVVYGIAFNVIPIVTSNVQSYFHYSFSDINSELGIGELSLMNPSNIDIGYKPKNECLGNQLINRCIGNPLVNKSVSNSLLNWKPCIRYKFKTPKSIKNSILQVEKFFQEKVDITYLDVVKAVHNIELFPDNNPFPKPKLSFSEYLLNGTVKGFFIGNNNPNINISLNVMNSVLIIRL